jgi:hypothetical protein
MNRQSITLTAKVIASDTDALYDIAKAKGINMPHPALGIFKSILCEIEKPNGNGVRLGEKATETAISTLIGTQINKNHGRSEIMGHTIDASINKNKEVEVVCIFFKDLYSEDWEEAQELFSKNKLTVSFELSADIESQDKLADGTKRLNDFYFTGLGLLFGVRPACKKARVFEMAAKKLQEKLSIERQSLIFANNQNSQKSIMEVLKLMADEVKKIEETVVAEAPKVEEPKVEEAKVEEPKAEEAKVEETATVTPEAPKVEEAKKRCPECNEPMEDDECSVCKKNKKASEEPKIEEAKIEEPKAEVKAEETPVEASKIEEVVVVTETTQKVTDTMKENSETIKVETETVRTVDNQVKEERKETVEVTYTYAQMEEVKAKYEKEISGLKEQLVAKDKEVETLKAAKEEKVEAKTDEPVVLATGHKKVEASAEDNVSPIGKFLRNKRTNR